MHKLLEIDQTLTLALNGSHSLFADSLAVTATQTIIWIPLVLVLLYLLIRNNDLTGIFGTILALALCILIADQTASSIFKPLVCRYRPTQDPHIMYLLDVVNGYRGGRYGFFSSHAANTMAIATFLALMVRHRTLTIWLFSWALLNCWTRVYLGVHYFGDLLVGTVWGIFTGWAVYKLWWRYCPGIKARTERNASRSNFTAGGFSIGSVRLLISGLAATYLYIVISSFFRC